jgi:hypothetical protein
MKRKNLENKIENKNSKNISNIFFLNKNTRENKNMNNFEFKIEEKIIVNNIEFSSRESAEKYILSEIFSNNSIEELLENPEINFQFISLFNKYRKKNENEKIVNPKNSSVKEYSNTGKPDMKSIQKLLNENNINLIIKRNNKEWPVYLFQNPNNSLEFFTIRNTKKVYELYEEILKNINNLDKFFQEYSYNPKEFDWKEEKE